MTTLSNGTAMGLVLELNERFDVAIQTGKKSEREKIAVQAGGWLHLQSLGGLAETTDADGNVVFVVSEEIANLLVLRNIKNKVDDFNRCAQLVLGMVVETITGKNEKKEANNLVGRCAKLYRALRFLGEVEEAGLPASEQGLTQWIIDNGGLDGVVADHKAATTADDGDEDAEDADTSEIEQALDNSAITVKANKPFAPPTLGLCFARSVDDDCEVLPLDGVPAKVMAELARYLPAPDANMPDRARIWAGAASLCQMFDRQDSEVLARPEEERHAGSPMAPSHPVVWIRGAREMTVAPTRFAAGMVARVASKVDTMLPGADIAWPRHLDGRETRKLADNMAGGLLRAAISDVAFDANTKALSFATGDTRVKPWNVKTRAPAAFGSSGRHEQWTLEVRKFEAKASSRSEETKGGVPEKLIAFANKVGGTKSEIVVKIAAGKLSMAQGKTGQPIAMGGKGDQSASAVIASADLYRVVQAIEAISALDAAAISVAIDTEGLVEFSADNRIASYRIFVPTLLDGGARNAALLERVRKPAPIAPAPVASADIDAEPVLEAA